MNYIAYNAVPILLLAITGLLIIMDKGGWGWPMGFAIALAVFPGTKNDDNSSA